MAKDTTAPRVRRTQEQIVADLEAKAEAARAKLNEKARKGFDAITVKYLKALDGVIENLHAAAQYRSELEAQAEALGIDTDRFNDTSVWYCETDDHDLVKFVDMITVQKTDPNSGEITEDQD